MSDTVRKGATLTEELKDVENPDKVILSAVPENKKKEVKEALMVIRSEMYSGPIPSPGINAILYSIASFPLSAPHENRRVLSLWILLL